MRLLELLAPPSVFALLEDPAAVEAEFVTMLLPFVHPEERGLFVGAVTERDESALRTYIGRYGLTVDAAGCWYVARPWPSTEVYRRPPGCGHSGVEG